MKYMIDIDGTICISTNSDYPNSEPIRHRITQFNKLFNKGHEVHYWTARGGNSGIDWSVLTKQQLVDWGVKHTSLKLGKPAYDVWIDDKAINVETYFEDPTNWT